MAGASDISVKVEGLDAVRKTLGDMLTPQKLRHLNRLIGINVRERTADHLARASVTRHRSSDRLGAMHSGFLEFAPARGQMRGGSNYRGTEDKPYTEVTNVTDGGVDVVIGNTPGLRRAFGPLTIRPVKAKALTIPLHRVSYARRVSELRAEGHEIFRPRGTNILAESDPSQKNGLRALYALVAKTVVPQDRGLLPKDTDYADWADETVETYLEAML